MSDYLIHYGVKGMKWGVRKRYYSSDGTLNARGQKKYSKRIGRLAKASMNGTHERMVGLPKKYDYTERDKVINRAVRELRSDPEFKRSLSNTKRASTNHYKGKDVEGSTLSKRLDDHSGVVNRKVDKMIDQYAKASMKDLKIDNRKELEDLAKNNYWVRTDFEKRLYKKSWK